MQSSVEIGPKFSCSFKQEIEKYTIWISAFFPPNWNSISNSPSHNTSGGCCFPMCLPSLLYRSGVSSLHWMASTALLARKTSPSGKINTVSEARWEGEFKDASWRSTTTTEKGRGGYSRGCDTLERLFCNYYFSEVYKASIFVGGFPNQAIPSYSNLHWKVDRSDKLVCLGLAVPD